MLSTASGTIVDFGKITIRSYSDSESGLQIFDDIVGVTQDVIANSEFLDTTGWHSPTTGVLGDT